MRRLTYVHDPMCSWCWGFRPVWAGIRRRLPPDLVCRNLLGGLAPDTDAPMTAEMRRYLQQTWRTIQRRIPGTEFNFEFWERCRPRRATWPACRAVIAARSLEPASEEPMILAIQRAYYLQARNPSETETLIALAAETGLEPGPFAALLDSPGVQARLLAEIDRGRRLGADGFPSLILERDGAPPQRLQLDYRDPEVVLAQLAEA